MCRAIPQSVSPGTTVYVEPVPVLDTISETGFLIATAELAGWRSTMTRTVGGGTSATLGDDRTTPMRSIAATTVAIGRDRGCIRRPNATSPRNVEGMTVDTTSHAAEAAATAHIKESAGLIR